MMPSEQQSLVDSPWFWAYVFTMSALVALALISPKYSQRQTQVEHAYQASQGAIDSDAAAGPEAAREPLIPLRPLFLVLAAITTAAWIVFYKTRLALHRPPNRKLET